jgi:kynurenine formamidase
MKDNAKFNANSPASACRRAVARQQGSRGGRSDNWGVEAFPNPDPNLTAPVHQLMLAKNGIYLHENLATEDLARDGVYEFAYVFAPLRLKGAPARPAIPIAIR